MTKIGLASDHAGFELKTFVKQYLAEHNIEYVDYGTDSEASCDYPDYAHALAAGLANGECTRGIAVCGSGEGISMSLNKHQHVRAALVWMPEIAHMTRLHTPRWRLPSWTNSLIQLLKVVATKPVSPRLRCLNSAFFGK